MKGGIKTNSVERGKKGKKGKKKKRGVRCKTIQVKKTKTSRGVIIEGKQGKTRENKGKQGETSTVSRRNMR